MKKPTEKVFAVLLTVTMLFAWFCPAYASSMELIVFDPLKFNIANDGQEGTFSVTCNASQALGCMISFSYNSGTGAVIGKPVAKVDTKSNGHMTWDVTVPLLAVGTDTLTVTVRNVNTDEEISKDIPVTVIGPDFSLSKYDVTVPENSSATIFSTITKPAMTTTMLDYKVRLNSSTLSWKYGDISGSGTEIIIMTTVPGTYTLDISLVDYFTGFVYTTKTVTVHVRSLTGISVSKLPEQTEFILADTFVCEGLELKAEYSDGTSRTITDGYTVSPPNMYIAGRKTITVSYQGKTAEYNIDVIDPGYPTYIKAQSCEIYVIEDFGDTDTIHLGVKINPENADYDRIVWSSSDTSFARVTQDGHVTLVTDAHGEAEITVTVYNHDGTYVSATNIVYVEYTDSRMYFFEFIFDIIAAYFQLLTERLEAFFSLFL